MNATKKVSWFAFVVLLLGVMPWAPWAAAQFFSNETGAVIRRAGGSGGGGGSTFQATVTIDGTDGNTPGLSFVNMMAGSNAIQMPSGDCVSFNAAATCLGAGTATLGLNSGVLVSPVTLQTGGSLDLGYNNGTGSLTNSGSGNGGDASLAVGKALRFLSTTQGSTMNSAATAGNPAFVMNTLNTMNAGDLILNVKNNGTSEFSVAGNGGVTVANGTAAITAAGSFVSGNTVTPQVNCNGASVCAFSAASTQITFIGQVNADGTPGNSGGGTTVDSQNGAAGSGATNAGGGGVLNMHMGNGGAGGTTGNGGGGGGVNWSTGNGGAAGSSTGTAGNAGGFQLSVGNGGAGSATLAAGQGGTVSITSGSGGANNGGGGATGGTWTQDTGASTGVVAAPTWSLFTTNGGTGTIGRSGQQVNFAGGIQVGGVQMDQTFCVYNAGNLASATAFGETTLTAAATVDTGSKVTQDVVGVGGGNFVVMVCTDGTTCAGGNQRLTYTESCTAAPGTRTAATVQNSGTVAAGTTLTISVTTACATTDPGANICVHYHY